VTFLLITYVILLMWFQHQCHRHGNAASPPTKCLITSSEICCWCMGVSSSSTSVYSRHCKHSPKGHMFTL